MCRDSENLIERRYDIDWLRNLAILLLFPFHAARVFDYWEPNYVTNVDLSWILSWFIAITAYWFMPLLFYLAGVSSRYALQIRDNKKYLSERINKLFIPLVFGVIVIVPPHGYFALKHHHTFNGTYFKSLTLFFTDFTDLSGYFGTFTPAHLWFILYLFVISLVFICVKRFLDRTINKGLLSNSWILVILFIPLTLTEALPSPAGKNFFYYFFLFIIGYMIGTDRKVLQLIDKVKFIFILVLIPYIPIWFVFAYYNQSAEDFSAISIFLAFMRNFALFMTLTVILGYGRKLLSKNNNFLRYANEAAFPVYIIHQSILIAISYYIVRLEIGIFAKFSLITVLTFLSCIFVYEGIRRFNITRWLFGMKPMKQEVKQYEKLPFK